MSQHAVETSYAWLDEAALSLAKASPQQVIEWAMKVFGEGLTIATGFGAEGMALIDMAARISTSIDIFFLDTGFLFPETYELRRRVEARYGIRIRSILPQLSPLAQERLHGAHLWSRDSDLCCKLRKLEPLRDALAGRDAWMTAIRRNQTAERNDSRIVEWDHRWGLVKINPLVSWTREMVWGYIRSNRVDYNPLHDRGYPSIGCTHCTTAVRAGENERAGRWAGRQKTECGLHGPRPADTLIQVKLISRAAARESEPQSDAGANLRA
jgi:phosphoadenosine phosphosulfate reductase